MVWVPALESECGTVASPPTLSSSQNMHTRSVAPNKIANFSPPPPPRQTTTREKNLFSISRVCSTDRKFSLPFERHAIQRRAAAVCLFDFCFRGRARQ